ncbi:RICIN domain-containing protein [Micromonosporaceae bacterium B7E4]
MFVGSSVRRRFAWPLRALLAATLAVVAASYPAAPARAATQYQFITVHSGMCVEVGWGGLNDGDLVNQYPCHGGANQKWFLENQPDGFQIRAVHTGKCLEAGRRHLVVKLAYQEQCTGTPFQRWLLIEVGEWPTNRFTFRNVHHSGECLGIYNNSQSEWAVAALLPCSHTAPNQHLTSPEIGYFPG